MSAATPNVWDSWPTEVVWQRVSPRLVLARLLGLVCVVIPLAAGVGVLAWLWWGWEWSAGLSMVVILVGVLRALVTRRAVRAWGYAEREDDLLVRHGLWTKRLSIVPYGRMQFIDVTAGPMDRMLGLATVQLHTAAASTDSTVPGLAPDAAAGLRDRLAQRATVEQEGL